MAGIVEFPQAARQAGNADWVDCPQCWGRGCRDCDGSGRWREPAAWEAALIAEGLARIACWDRSRVLRAGREVSPAGGAIMGEIVGFPAPSRVTCPDYRGRGCEWCRPRPATAN